MPDHTSWLTLLLQGFSDTLEHNAHVIGDSFVGKKPATWMSFEPIVMSLLIAFAVIVMSLAVRAKLAKVDEAVVPDDRLTLRTFMEVFLGYFYDLAKGIMGPERAKKYFPLIGASAIFIFCANVMALIPGVPVATSTPQHHRRFGAGGFHPVQPVRAVDQRLRLHQAPGRAGLVSGAAGVPDRARSRCSSGRSRSRCGSC